MWSIKFANILKGTSRSLSSTYFLKFTTSIPNTFLTRLTSSRGHFGGSVTKNCFYFTMQKPSRTLKHQDPKNSQKYWKLFKSYLLYKAFRALRAHLLFQLLIVYISVSIFFLYKYRTKTKKVLHTFNMKNLLSFVRSWRV